MPTSSTNRAAVMRPAHRGLGVEAVRATPTFSDLADIECEFLIEAAQVKQQRAKTRELSAARHEADTSAIEAIADAMLEIAAGDQGALRNCDRETLAASRVVALYAGPAISELRVEAAADARFR